MFNVLVKAPDDLLTRPPNSKWERFSHHVISSLGRFTSSSDIDNRHSTFDSFGSRQFFHSFIYRRFSQFTQYPLPRSLGRLRQPTLHPHRRNGAAILLGREDVAENLVAEILGDLTGRLRNIFRRQFLSGKNALDGCGPHWPWNHPADGHAGGRALAPACRENSRDANYGVA